MFYKNRTFLIYFIVYNIWKLIFINLVSYTYCYNENINFLLLLLTINVWY